MYLTFLSSSTRKFRMEAMSPGYESEADAPLHRDVAEHIDSLKKENFNLKLRIYHMEEHINSKGMFNDLNYFS